MARTSEAMSLETFEAIPVYYAIRPVTTARSATEIAPLAGFQRFRHMLGDRHRLNCQVFPFCQSSLHSTAWHICIAASFVCRLFLKHLFAYWPHP